MTKSRYIFVLAITLSSLLLCQAQTPQTEEWNDQLTPEEFRHLATTCAPDVPLITLRAIARTESAFHPYALSLDYPQRTAKEHGFTDGGIFLAHQPKNLVEARTWTHWLLRRGRSVSIGLMQISTQHTADFGLTADQLFDPCINIRAGAQILTAQYRRTAAVLGEGQEALQQSLSEYNSGSSVLGLANGYVSSVVTGEFRMVEPGATTRQQGGGRPSKNRSQDTGWPRSSFFADSGAVHTGRHAEPAHRRGGGN
jgi:type IV secretion system protein VirB1